MTDVFLVITKKPATSPFAAAICNLRIRYKARQFGSKIH